MTKQDEIAKLTRETERLRAQLETVCDLQDHLHHTTATIFEKIQSNVTRLKQLDEGSGDNT